MYQFPTAAVTSRYTFIGFFPLRFYPLTLMEVRNQVLGGRGGNPGVGRAGSFRGSARIIPCLCRLLEATWIPWLVTPSFVFEARRVSFSDLSLLCRHIACSSLSPLAPLPPSLRALVVTFRAHPDNPGSSPHPKVLNSTTSPTSLLLSNVAYPQVPEVRMFSLSCALCPQGGGDE